MFSLKDSRFSHLRNTETGADRLNRNLSVLFRSSVTLSPRLQLLYTKNSTIDRESSQHPFTTARHSHIVHIAGVWHLLDVDAGSLSNSGEHSAHRSLHQVLNIHETTPNITHVTEGVSSWTRIPKPEVKTTNAFKRNHEIKNSSATETFLRTSLYS